LVLFQATSIVVSPTQTTTYTLTATNSNGSATSNVTVTVTTPPVATNFCQIASIPAYFYPTPSTPSTDLWRIATNDTASAGRVIIMNPNNGPGTAVDSNYATDISFVHGRSALVIGYVFTSYGARPLADVKAEIDKYYSWYSVDGIFFDESSNCGFVSVLLPTARPIRALKECERHGSA
jgi:hypothetical protein